jgi:RimJ/RimL family protein N-acetyltransferase
MSSGSPLLRREGVAPGGARWLIRPARAGEDAAALVALRDAVAAEGDLIAGAPGERTALEEGLLLGQLLTSGGLAVALEVEGEVVGQLLVARGRAPYESHRGDVSLAIRAEWRGMGLGRALLDTGVDWARAVGIAKLTLSVFPGNQRAVALYRAVGFVEEGVLRRHLRTDGGERDIAVMALFL